MNALLESFAQYFSASFVSSDLAVLWKFIPFVLFVSTRYDRTGKDGNFR